VLQSDLWDGLRAIVQVLRLERLLVPEGNRVAAECSRAYQEFFRKAELKQRDRLTVSRTRSS
jgi:hypothetical protein